ncbi:MAG: RnfH family protein [Woeseiaceae bacterium]|nr:RnfH family protein [Woeseiaceae bacterium]
MAIEVVFALPERQELISLTVEPGTTVAMAIRQCAIGDLFPEEDLAKCQAGIWGKPVGRDHPLKDGDRLELYRRLSMDPREARRKLAAVGRSMGQPADDPRRQSKSAGDARDSD